MNEEINKEYKKLCPFKGWVLENFPFIEADFDAITNYELICKVVEYLNKMSSQFNMMIDNLNYINNWLSTLDLQDEVDNKLDEMVESGELQEIIASYLNANALWCFDTVNDMKQATNLINGSFAKTLGYYEKNDGGASLYKIRNITNEDTVNNMDIIALNDETLIAEIVVNKQLQLKQFGATEENPIQDILNRAISYCSDKGIEIIIDDDYKFTNEINLVSNTNINGNNHLLEYDSTSYLGNTLYIEEDSENITIKNVKIDGKEKVKRGIYGINLTNVLIKNCDINNLSDQSYGGFGIIIYTGNKILIEDCSINNIISEDLGMMAGDGILLHNNLNCLVNNNIINNCGRHNIAVTGLGGNDFNNQYDVKITNNYLANSYLSGIDNEASENVLISGNTFRNNGDSATNPLSNGISIKTEGSSYTTKLCIVNNNFKSTNENTSACILADNGNGETIISNNIFDCNTKIFNLYTGNGAKKLIISNNIMKNADKVFQVYSTAEQYFSIIGNLIINCTHVLFGSTFRNSIFNNNTCIDCDYLFYGANNLNYSMFSDNYIEINNGFTNNQLSLLKTSFTNNTIKYLGETSISLLFKYNIRNQDLYNKFIGNFFCGDITHIISIGSNVYDEDLNGNTYYHIIYDNNMIAPL